LQHFDGWESRRSKIHDLMTALREGPAQVSLYTQRYLVPEALSLPDGGAVQDGWYNKDDEWHCAFYDALELLDFYQAVKGRD